MADRNDPSGGLTTIVVDDTGRQVIAAALDLYQRIGIGQWNRAVNVAAVNMAFGVGSYDLGRMLDELRARHTIRPTGLGHPDASLGVAEAGERTRLAHDLWHALDGGMPDRRRDRIAPGHIIRVNPVDDTPAVLRAAAAGRDEYRTSAGADSADDDALAHEAAAFRLAADMIESGDRAGFLRDTCPSWRWAGLGVDIVDGGGAAR